MAHQSVGTRLMAKLAPNSTMEVEALKAQVRDLQASNAQMQEMVSGVHVGYNGDTDAYILTTATSAPDACDSCCRQSNTSFCSM